MVRRLLFLILLSFIFISFFNSANSEDKAADSSKPSGVVGIKPETYTQVPAATAVETLPVSSSAPAVSATPEPEVPVESSQIKPEEEPAVIILDDSLPVGAITDGKWEWDSSLKYSGEKSHTEPAAKGISEHSCRVSAVDVPDGYLLEQYVYIDPVNIPSGLMVKFRFESEGREGEIGVYREAEEEVFVFNNDEAVIYDGVLPETGRWEKWVIDPDDLGLKGAKITGISFAVYGGRANWDLTRFVPSKKQNTKPAEGANN